MDQEEKDKIFTASYNLSLWELTPGSWFDPYSDMISEEKSKLIIVFFGSDRRANISVSYHAIISTCKMHGISALDFLKKFFYEVVFERRDYENLLPMTIGLKSNKI